MVGVTEMVMVVDSMVDHSTEDSTGADSSGVEGAAGGGAEEGEGTAGGEMGERTTQMKITSPTESCSSEASTTTQQTKHSKLTSRSGGK